MPDRLQIRVTLSASRGYVAHSELLPRGEIAAFSLSSLRWRVVNSLQGREVVFALSKSAREHYARQQAFIAARKLRPVATAV
jgi:hypothetical protein